MPPKKATTAASAVSTKTKAAPKSASAIAEPAKSTRAPSGRKSSAVATIVTKTTIVKTTKRKASEIEDEAPAPVKKSKTSPAELKTKAAPPKTAPKATAKAPAKKAAPKKAAAPEKASAEEEESDSESDEEPAPKEIKTAAKAAPKKTAAKAAPKKVTKVSPKSKAAPKKAVKAPEESSDEESGDEEVVAKPKAKPAPKAATTKKVAAPKVAKSLPVLNTPPTQILDVFVFGEGSAGELGLGWKKGADGKKVTEVTRPRLNPLLSAKDVGVVQLAVGGMHCVALTKDNKILTWGVNDQGALGRPTPVAGKMVELPADGGNSDSESDSDDEDSGLNPNESEPRPVDSTHIPDGTIFASVHAGDSISLALTNTGLVYGWGTFRGNDGIIGFRSGVKIQESPVLIPELKDITRISVGTNHVLALNKKGKVFTWGAGEQSQLARRVVSRTAVGALVPREFGLQRKKIVHIGCGDYHSFVVDDKGAVYSWGLNSFGQTGVPKDEETNENAIATPTLVKSLKDYDIKQIAGGAHHTLACTTAGQVLVWGRIDSCEAGVEIEDLPKDHLFVDENGRPRYLVKPAVVPGIDGVYIATGPDTCIAVDKEGVAWSWGFSSNYQTGQGTGEDVVEATEIANTAVKNKKIVFAGVGGQFGVLGGIHEDVVMTNGV